MLHSSQRRHPSSSGGCLVEEEPYVLERKGSRRKEWSLNAESFDQLLAWLNEDREQAGKKYEEIRSMLVRGFKSHGCTEAEELADETIDRVARRLPEIIATYTGNPARYFYGVAHNVHLEYLRNGLTLTPLPDRELQERPAGSDDIEPLYACLERCMQKLDPQSRELILKFYQGEKGRKIRLRKELAAKLSIKLANLRLQAFRIRTELKKCIQRCMEHEIAG